MTRPKILIVEDEAIVAADLASKVRHLDYDVVGIVTEGKEAVEVTKEVHPDLILMDIRLEGQYDGIQAMEEIHRYLDIPVIYLTAHSDVNTLARAKLTDPFGYILKPFDERELRTQIELALFKHNTELMIKQQRELLHVTLKSIGDAVIATDADGKITFMNPVAESLTGWGVEEAIGKPATSVFQIINEQSQQKLMDPLTRAIQEGRPVTIENHTALLSKNGRAIPIEDCAAPIHDASGSVIGGVLVFHDVTQKRHDDGLLRMSEFRLKRSQEIAHLGSWELDLVGNRLTWSDEVYRIFGLEPGEFEATYEAFLESVHPDDRSAVDDAYSSSIREERDTYEIEHRIINRTTGEVRFVHERCNHIRDGSGRVIRSIGMVHDITDRKIAEETIRRATQRYALLSETAGALLAARDPQTVLESLCRKVMVLLECDVFLNFLVDETVEQMRLNAYAGFTETKAKEIRWIEHSKTLTPCITRDRHCIITEVNQRAIIPHLDIINTLEIRTFCCHPLIAGDRLIGTLLFGRKGDLEFSIDDIELMRSVADQVAVAIERIRTERELRISDEKLRSVLDHSLDAIYRYNIQDQRFEYFSPACKSIFGQMPDTLMALNEEETDSFVHPDDRMKKAEDLTRILSTGEGTIEYRWRNSDGDYRWLAISLSIVYDQAGKPLYQNGIARDITEMKNIMDDLKRTNENLKQFAYIASHDLQEPLRIMSSYSKLLKDRYGDKLDTDAQDFIGFIVGSAAKMQVMIKDLLIYSRSDQKEMKVEEVDLNEVLRRIKVDMSDTICDLSATVSIDEMPIIRSDRESITHVFQNLISNALKFRGQEPPNVHVQARETEGEWTFIVIDNGIGIDPMHHQKIFHIFYRLHSREQYPGTGVGLTICKNIIERMGGRIWVESQPGMGSKFFFTLPQDRLNTGDEGKRTNDR